VDFQGKKLNVKKNVIKNDMKFDNYSDRLFGKQEYRHKMNLMSKKHEIGTFDPLVAMMIRDG